METNIDHNANNTNMFFDMLCDEILVMIVSFSDLSIIDKFNLFSASKRLHTWVDELLINLSVINRMTLMRTSHQTISSNDLALILSKCLNVKHIDLSHIRVNNKRVVSDAAHDYSDNSSVVIMSAIAHNSHHLESINFGLLDVNNAQFEAILTNCSQLKPIASKTIDDDTLRHIIQSPNLEALDLSDNTKISGEALENIGPNITELNLNTSLIDLKPLIKQYYTVMEAPVAGDYADRKEFRRALYKFKSSKRLNHLQPNRDKIGKIKIRKLSVCITSDDMLTKIGECFRQVEHIGLNVTRSGCYYSQLDDLRSLYSVAINANRFDECIRSLRYRREEIRELEVSVESGSGGKRFDYNSIRLLAICTPHLRKLVLRQFDGVTICGLFLIAELTNLQHLDLMNCSNIGDDGVVRVIESCDRLRELNLHNCVRIGPSVLQSFILRCDTFTDGKFTLDVINTGINKIDSLVAMPTNLNLLVNIDQCIYDCWHN